MVSSKISDATSTSSESDFIVISPSGDLILEVTKDGSKECAFFKVESEELKEHSRYFARLLDSNAWQEGRSMAEHRSRLTNTYQSFKEVPDEDLPHIAISDIGQTSTVRSIKYIMGDFLRILHGQDITTAAKTPPTSNIANIAVLADRFDAIDVVALWAKSKKNVGPRIILTVPAYDEELYRQRLLICLLLQMDSRLATYTAQLILQGSTMWLNASRLTQALWWDLPRGMEEELQVRRNCVLETIGSLQTYLVSLYCSKSRNCKLGYDTSPQCDSFQLGQFIKFLNRMGCLDFQSPFVEAEAPAPYAGDVRKLLRDLRACPSYQVDEFHAHCGPKKLLVAGVDVIERQLTEVTVGVCASCWRDSQTAESWATSKQAYRHTNSGPFSQYRDKTHDHQRTRAFFTGVDRDWERLLT